VLGGPARLSASNVIVREDRCNRDPKEPDMHPVVVKVSITDVEQPLLELHEQVVPMASQAPRFVSGVWMESGDGKGIRPSSSKRALVLFPGGEPGGEVCVRAG
jgi:hypothetical protein